MLVKARFHFPEFVFGILFAVAVFAMGMVFTGSYETSPPAQNQSHQTESASPNNKLITDKHTNETQDAQHKKEKGEFWSAKLTDWLLAIFTLFLVAFTGALVRSTNKLWNAAIDSDEQTRELFAADQRPWINLDNPKIRISDDETRLTFEIDGVNIGKTPAFAVEVRAKAFKSQVATPSVQSVKDFAKTINSPSDWKNSRRAIFPDVTAALTVFDEVKIAAGKRGDFVRVTYCVTYFANGDPKIYRTAGEVIFNKSRVDGSDNNGDWFSVSHFTNDIGVTYAD